MNYEERYKEALAIAKKLDEEGCHVLRDVFPELAESEEEKIRKAIIEHFKQEEDKFKALTFNGYYYKDVYAWLEKQGEQKSVEWSEEDKNKVADYLYFTIGFTRAASKESAEDICGSLRPQKQ